MTKNRLLWLLPLCFLMACGPSDQEIGIGVICSLPFVLGITYGVFRLFYSQWAKARPGLEMQAAPWRNTLIVCVIGMIAGFILSMRGGDNLVLLAVWVFGSSYLTLTLVTWRIWLAISPRTAFSWSFFPVLLVMAVPALLMMLGFSQNFQDTIMPLYMLPGFWGVVTVPVFLIFLIEALVRGSRASTVSVDVSRAP